MLKIKDSVDLKELEKFGFENSFIDEDNVSIKTPNYMYDEICIDKEDRIIFINSYCDKLDILFDLIQAGLVEKVDDK